MPYSSKYPIGIFRDTAYPRLTLLYSKALLRCSRIPEFFVFALAQRLAAMAYLNWAAHNDLLCRNSTNGNIFALINEHQRDARHKPNH
jgi:hypothetical protein